ncbi:matrixin family metalloprotease [Streptomyces hydrogenans]|uniref:matrixin family metalloprotease n=1 Tax=Streptomyces hydrogenans TaxID=1873719 RepID=UPI0036738CA4
MRTNTLGFAAASAAAALLAVPAPAHAAPSAARPYACVDGLVDSRGRSSVDGTEIAWDDESKFDDARKYAVRVWGAGTLKQVKIVADGATAYADLEFRDVSSVSGQWRDVYGKWSPQHGTDHLLMNRAYLDDGKRRGTDEHRRRVAAHELGHALGFCHKSYDEGRSLLWADYGQIAEQKLNGPTAKDIKAYHALWG